MDPIAIVVALAVAGALAGKRVTPAGAGTLRTDTPTFAFLLVFVVVLIGACCSSPCCSVAPRLVMTGISQVAFPDKADGSQIERDGTVVGSKLIGQDLSKRAGSLPRPPIRTRAERERRRFERRLNGEGRIRPRGLTRAPRRPPRRRRAR